MWKATASISTFCCWPFSFSAAAGEPAGEGAAHGLAGRGEEKPENELKSKTVFVHALSEEDQPWAGERGAAAVSQKLNVGGRFLGTPWTT